MKKFYFFITLIIFASLVFVSCVDNTYNLVLNNISEIREQVLIYKDDIYYISLMSGQREKDYIADGIANELVDFAVLNVDFLNDNFKYNEMSVKYSLIIDNKEYSGDMLNNPYNNNFVIDLGIKISAINEISVKLIINDEEKTFNLVNISNNWVNDAKTALKIASEDLSEYIKQEIEDNNLKAEAFIKVVYNDEYTTDYYYYIQIISQNGNSYSEIINPNTGEILAKNIS